MRRRAFIRLLSGVFVGWPIIVDAQGPGRTYRIGFLIPIPRDRPAVAAFFDELRLKGFIEKQNLEVPPAALAASTRNMCCTPNISSTQCHSRRPGPGKVDYVPLTSFAIARMCLGA